VLRSELRMISIDDHLVEHPTTWTDRLPSRYADTMPHIVELDGGLQQWKFEGVIAGSFLSRREVELADVIGRDGLTYASDYPHVEGIWPHSKVYLHEVFAGLSPALARQMCAENAARLYRFDLDHLDELAATVGPLVEDVVGGTPSPQATHTSDRMAARAARPADWVMAGVSRLATT